MKQLLLNSTIKYKLIIFFPFILPVLFTGCFQLIEAGPATVLKEFSNSDKSKKAVLFIKGGNATSADSFQISILNKGENLGETAIGNTFTCDNDYGKAHTDLTTIKIIWLETNKLKIFYEKHIRTFTRVNEINDVYVFYQAY